MAAKGAQQGGPDLRQEVTTEVFRSRTQWGNGKPLPDFVVLYGDSSFVAHGFQVGEMRQSFGKADGEITPEGQCWWQIGVRIGKTQQEQPGIGFRMIASVQFLLEMERLLVVHSVGIRPLDNEPAVRADDDA
jgi:hypothetical protein